MSQNKWAMEAAEAYSMQLIISLQVTVFSPACVLFTIFASSLDSVNSG